MPEQYLRGVISSALTPRSADRSKVYDELVPQVRELFRGEPDLLARMANLTAVIREAFGHHWVGFYRVIGDDLVLGPFQGPPACTRIPYGHGVCGTAWAQGVTLIVDDVELFPGHIACSPLSRSEIVVPVRGPDQRVSAVLDLDSEQVAAFDHRDRTGLEALVTLLVETA
ncbi:MAG: GAF domain-containing protein [Flavobacteriales bacterium]|nr:GAF domain-containing protein [Flavobacteriales bacterium]